MAYTFTKNVKQSVSHVSSAHSKIIIWDNNFLALPNWKEKMQRLKSSHKWIDFNQGLDARLMTKEKAEALAQLKIKDIKMAYDGDHEKKAAHKAVDLLENAGFNRRKLSFYTLYNFYDMESTFYDTPDTFYTRVVDILEMGCTSYPTRFVPFDTLSKNGFVSKMWKGEQPEAVARARRVIGFGSAFPPYEALINKFKNAGYFDEAFRLEPPSVNTETNSENATSSNPT